MSDATDTDDVDEREAIREKKIAELREQAGQEGQESGASTESPGEPVHVTSPDHLDDLLQEHDVVLVDFYADWCGPCKMLEPTVAAIAAETGATVAKVDIDAHQQLAGKYQVQGVPTLYLFADGQPVERMVGVQDKGTLQSLVQQHT